MRINPVNFNNMPQRQNFGAVKEIKPGCADKFLSFTTKQIADKVSNIKGMDVWFFDRIKGPVKDGKVSMVDGCHVILKTDRKLIGELSGTPDKKGAILEQLKKILLWFEPEHNEKAAAVVKKIDTLDVKGIEAIDKTYVDKGAKDAALKAILHESMEGQRFINDFRNELHQIAESSKATSWQDKIDEIIAGGASI